MEQEYRERMAKAKEEYGEYHRAGGEEDEFLAWLYYSDRDLFNDMQRRWRFQSSYTCITGGVMFHPRPPRYLR